MVCILNFKQTHTMGSYSNNNYSRTSMDGKALEPYKYVRGTGSSSK